MKKAKNMRVVLVTCGSAGEAERIARAVVKKRLAACVNRLQAPVRSVYWWKGRVQRSTEHLLLIKTQARLLRELRSEVLRLHAYELPEFIALPIVGGAPRYLDWMAHTLRATANRDAARKRSARRHSRPG